jgi:Cu(I)/Ag(I) efflux system membrane fusion protein
MHFLKPVAIIALILGVFIGIGIDRYWLDTDGTNMALPAGETSLEHARKHLDPDYVCPMHAKVVAKEPGSCPICGMDLVKQEPAVITETDAAILPEVLVTPEFIHNFGVRTAIVTRGPVSRDILALGRVSRMPLPKVTDVAPGLNGTILSVSDTVLGGTVSKGEWLYSVDTPAWRALQQNYLDALQEEDPTRANQLRQRLLSLGMQPAALSRLTTSGQIEEVLDRHAPVGGTITEWRAGKGDTVEATAKVVTLGGMNRIPVIVNLFEGQGAWIDRGQRITVRVPTMPGTEYEGQVDRTDREINFSTRTLPVYVGFSTPDARLRYGMLVEVTIHTSARDNVLQIPREALIRTGEGSRVILARGDGRFQPVAVVPGLESGDVIEVISGLEEGQEIVVSGQFLIDSESSLRADFQRMEAGDDL